MKKENLTVWLVLTFRLPHKPSAPRVRVWRQLQNIGAVALKESVYVLPENKETIEDFQWLEKEITSGKGEAVVFTGTILFGMTEREVIQVFNEARDKDYVSLIEKCGKLLMVTKNAASSGVAKEGLVTLQAAAVKLKQEFEVIGKRDFFSSGSKEKAASVIATINKSLQEAHSSHIRKGQKMNETTFRIQDFHKKLWKTRRNIFIDRIASAWLIKKFIDTRATFAFVTDASEAPRGIPFDMEESEFTHCGDNCTFETMIKLFALKNHALDEIAQIVHDIDLKDGKFSRPEAAGLEQILDGLSRIHSDDRKLLKRGMEIFDSLYSHFSGKIQIQNKKRSKTPT